MTASPPVVSVCVAAHNTARWLPATLESVLTQTYPALEIIVVDDGSTDDTLALARNHARRHPDRLLVEAQPNAGAASARNHALRLSRGHFVKFLDADDLLSPEMIALQVAALAGQPGAVAYGEWARFREDPAEAVFTPHPGWHNASPVDWLVESWADAEPMMQCGQYLLPRDLLDRAGGWDERLSLIDDFEFFTRLTAASAGVVFTPGARLYYRSGLAGSLSAQKSPQAWRSAFLSTTLGTGHLLAREDSPRTRRAVATILQRLVHDMYPSRPDLVAALEARVSSLGGCDLAPPGGRGFQLARRLLGWKLARRLQIFAGRAPAPAPQPQPRSLA